LDVGGVCNWDLLVSCTGGFQGEGLASASHLRGDAAATANGMVPPGSPDFCAVAQDFVNAGLGTSVSSAATGCQIFGFSGFNTGTPGTPGGPIAIFPRQSLNRGPLSIGLAQSICELIHGPSTVNCPEVVVLNLGIRGTPTPITGCKSASEPGTNCLSQGPDSRWNMYTGGYVLTLPDQLWGLYSSQFASDLCAGSPNQLGANYDYLCNSNLDYWANNSEFGATPGAAIANLQVAMDIFGNNTFTIPVFGHALPQSPYLKGWTGVSNATGIGPGNYWSLLNMWDRNPAVSVPQSDGDRAMRLPTSARTTSAPPLKRILSLKSMIVS
jgi:hypothetical protein